MKRLGLLSISLLVSVCTIAQETPDISNQVMARSEPLGQTGDNEIRLNMLTAIIGYPEINYERFLTDNMGVGMAAAISLESKEDMSLRWFAMPYYRLYFGDKKASGFFIEGNLAVINQTAEDYDYTTGQYLGLKNYTNGGIGAAVGGKFLTRNGFVGEVYGGVGRLFGNSPTDVYPRFGISIGKRF